MMRLVLAFLLLAITAAGAHAGSVSVTIEGVRSDRGQVMVAIFSRPDGFPDGEFADQHTKVPAGTRPLTVVFDGLSPGRYAVGAYHDENRSGELDTNFFGWPLEGYALSNGIRLGIFRPRFADAAFSLDREAVAIVLHMGY